MRTGQTPRRTGLVRPPAEVLVAVEMVIRTFLSCHTLSLLSVLSYPTMFSSVSTSSYSIILCSPALQLADLSCTELSCTVVYCVLKTWFLFYLTVTVFVSVGQNSGAHY